MITDVINEKSNNKIFLHESRYEYLNDDENDKKMMTMIITITKMIIRIMIKKKIMTIKHNF